MIEIGGDGAGEAQQADGQEAEPQPPLEGSAKDGESCSPTAANPDGICVRPLVNTYRQQICSKALCFLSGAVLWILGALQQNT